MKIPQKLTLDRNTNAYVRMGRVPAVGSAGPTTLAPEDFATSQLGSFLQRSYKDWLADLVDAHERGLPVNSPSGPAYRLAVDERNVAGGADGMLAWLDLYTAGWENVGGKIVAQRPEAQLVTQRWYMARVTFDATGQWPPLPGPLVGRFAGWEEVGKLPEPTKPPAKKKPAAKVKKPATKTTKSAVRKKAAG